MKNNKGFSLTEVVVTCAILAIIGGIGLANFGSYEAPTQKRELLQSAKIFSMSVKNCLLNVSSMGGWVIKKPTFGGENKCPEHCLRPCEVVDSNQEESRKSLQKKIGWKCPGDHCQGYVDSAPDDSSDWYVMDIRKEVKGTKYQVIVHFDIKKQRESIYCRTNASYYAVVSGDYNATPSYASWNANNTDKQCEWPKDSKP